MIRSTTVTVLIAGLIGCGSAMAAEPIGVITILDGDATLIRGVSKFSLAEGVRIAPNDLVETGKSAFVRIEFPDGAIVDLGPATRTQLNRPSLRRGNRPALYLLAGWLKLSADKLSAGARGSVASREFDVLGVGGEAVAYAQSGADAVFAEYGVMRVIDRRRGAATPVSLESGDYLALHGNEPGRVEREAAREFVVALPRQFEDRLPARIALFQERDIAAKPAGSFTYAEVEPWLDAEATIRRRFVRDWAAKADDDAFRHRLETGLARHPEWEPILHPERFEPKPAPPVASTPAAPDGTTPH